MTIKMVTPDGKGTIEADETTVVSLALVGYARKDGKPINTKGERTAGAAESTAVAKSTPAAKPKG